MITLISYFKSEVMKLPKTTNKTAKIQKVKPLKSYKQQKIPFIIWYLTLKKKVGKVKV